MLETLAARIRSTPATSAGAEKILAAARAAFPDAAAVKLAYADVLQRLGRTRRRSPCSTSWRRAALREPRVYQMIAKSYAALGQRTQQHRALAESYLLQGSLPAAIEQLQFAQAAGDYGFLHALGDRRAAARAESAAGAGAEGPPAAVAAS